MKENNEEYKHIEAYCLMTYKCEKCGHTEIVWNSRDGITPFIINCERCGKHMQHSISKDIRNKNYIPKSGQRVFIDMPLNYYKVMCRVKAKYIKEHIEGNTDKLQRIYNNLLKEYNKNEPFLVKI